MTDMPWTSFPLWLLRHRQNRGRLDSMQADGIDAQRWTLAERIRAEFAVMRQRIRLMGRAA